MKKVICTKLPGMLFLFGILFSSFTGCNNTNSKKGFYDENAIGVLDKVSETIGNLNSCSYLLSTDESARDSGVLTTTHKQSDVYMRGPNKMHVYTEGEESRKGYWYNGSQLAVFRLNEKQYDVIPAPGNILAMIDSVNNVYGVDFPAADFFYPNLTDNVINIFDTIAVVGSTTIDSVVCKEINATNSKMDVYIAIDESTNLPKRLEIYYLGDKLGENYFATFSNWKLNPALPDELFNFSPPEDANKATLFTKNLVTQ